MRRLLPLLTLFVLVLAGCPRKGTEPERPSAPEPPPKGAEPTTDPSPAKAPSAGPDVRMQEADSAAQAGVEEAVEMPSLEALSWSFSPTRLDVMRATHVDFEATWEGAPMEQVVCRWDPGDRSGQRVGCRIRHEYATGLTDRSVTLVVDFQGKEVFRESRALPLERLPVEAMPGETDELPQPPGEGGLRVLHWALFEEPSAEDVQAFGTAVSASQAQLAVVFFHCKANGALTDRLVQAAGKAPLVPLYCQGGRRLPKRLDKRLLSHGDSAEFPYRHAFLFRRALFAVLDARVRGNSMDQEKWLLEQLASGGIASHRLALSCRPLESYTAAGENELTPQFRYYEKLLRGDVSLFVASGAPVFFHGAYGNLPTVSAGCANGQPGTLLSEDATQSATAAVVDLEPNRPASVYAISPTAPGTIMDTVSFPAKVGNYVRKY